MFNLSPADELASIRAELARLKRREAELRAAYLTDTELPKIGRWHRVEVLTQRANIFDPRLLPEEIRNDPAYRRERVTHILRSTRIGARPAFPELVAEAEGLSVFRPRARPRSPLVRALRGS